MDEEILQDFLVEAGELYENLNEQLVELERDPLNADLLNAIFRGFHEIPSKTLTIRHSREWRGSPQAHRCPCRERNDAIRHRVQSQDMRKN